MPKKRKQKQKQRQKQRINIRIKNVLSSAGGAAAQPIIRDYTKPVWISEGPSKAPGGIPPPPYQPPPPPYQPPRPPRGPRPKDEPMDQPPPQPPHAPMPIRIQPVQPINVVPPPLLAEIPPVDVNMEAARAIPEIPFVPRSEPAGRPIVPRGRNGEEILPVAGPVMYPGGRALDKLMKQELPEGIPQIAIPQLGDDRLLRKPIAFPIGEPVGEPREPAMQVSPFTPVPIGQRSVSEKREREPSRLSTQATPAFTPPPQPPIQPVLPAPRDVGAEETKMGETELAPVAIPVGEPIAQEKPRRSRKQPNPQRIVPPQPLVAPLASNTAPSAALVRYTGWGAEPEAGTGWEVPPTRVMGPLEAPGNVLQNPLKLVPRAVKVGQSSALALPSAVKKRSAESEWGPAPEGGARWEPPPTRAIGALLPPGNAPVSAVALVPRPVRMRRSEAPTTYQLSRIGDQPVTNPMPFIADVD